MSEHGSNEKNEEGGGTETILVKIGGSCFSNKQDPRSFRQDVVDGICEQLKRINVHPIIIHGGGSFGHPLAKEFKIKAGRNPGINGQDLGFCRTHAAMEEVNAFIVGRFLEHGLPAYPVQSSAIFRTRNDMVVSSHVETIEALHVAGFIPVLYGDTVIDETKGFTILSGDTIMVHLVNLLDVHVSKLVYLLDVPGLFVKNPKKHPDARRIPVVELENGEFYVREGEKRLLLFEILTSEDSAIDVTGGILFKLEEMKKIQEKRPGIFLVNGHEPGVLDKLHAGTLESFTRVIIKD